MGDASTIPPKRILIVDDEPMMLEVLGRILRDAGYAAETAKNGEEGLHKFRSHSWDLIVTDRSMPVMDGEAMSAAIRETAAGVPIVLATGTPGAIGNEKLFDEILHKPMRPAELLRCVARHMK